MSRVVAKEIGLRLGDEAAQFRGKKHFRLKAGVGVGHHGPAPVAHGEADRCADGLALRVLQFEAEHGRFEGSVFRFVLAHHHVEVTSFSGFRCTPCQTGGQTAAIGVENFDAIHSAAEGTKGNEGFHALLCRGKRVEKAHPLAVHHGQSQQAARCLPCSVGRQFHRDT